ANGVFKGWWAYMTATIKGLQVRSILLGTSILSGMAIAGHHSLGKAATLSLILAVFVAMRKIAISADVGATVANGQLEGAQLGYGVVWPTANVTVSWMNTAVEQNQKELQHAMALLASTDLKTVREGVYRLKQLYARGQDWGWRLP